MDVEYYKMESGRQWRERAAQVPFLRFDPDWEVAVTPPFGGADARFRVRQGKAFVSVYLDFDSHLGYMDEPYWELHPSPDGDVERFLLNDADGLIRGIAESIAAQLAEPTP